MAAYVFLLTGFLAGSVPFGLLLVRLAGRGDVRSVGSGNIGATNVARAGGRLLGILALALDVSKGYLPVFFAHSCGLEDLPLSLVALAAVAGHIYTPWLRFRGGKGVATALGASLAFKPLAVLPSLWFFFLITTLTRFVSLGSVLGALALPVALAAVLLNNHAAGEPIMGPLAILAPWMVIAAIVVIKHGANLQRVSGGTENPLWGNKQREQGR